MCGCLTRPNILRARLLRLQGILAGYFALKCRGMTQESQIERIEVVHKTPVMFYRPNQPLGGHYLKVPAPQLRALQCCFHALIDQPQACQQHERVRGTEWRLGIS